MSLVRASVRRVLRCVLDVLYPPRCASCGRGEWPFCDECRRAVVALLPPGCIRCGLPAEEDLTRCRECLPAPIDGARAPFLYAGPVRAALLRLKFSGWRTVAEALGRAMAAMKVEAPDVVTWVPLAPGRRARRGYDQAKALAAVVAEMVDVPARSLLSRTRETPPQSGRGAAERRRAMRGAFRVAARDPPKKVLLVDDVLTTGATAAECARTLKAAGSGSVFLLAAARAFSGPLPARCYTRADSRLGLWLPGDPPR